MKKRFCALGCLLMTVLLAGCAFSNGEFSLPEQEPSVDQTITEPSQEEPPPPPDLSSLYELTCMENRGHYETMVECGEGLLAAVTVPQLDGEGQTRTLTVFDAEANTVLSEAKLPAAGTLICARSNGELLFYDSDTLTVSLYDLNGSLDRTLVLPEDPTLFDAEEDRFYFTAHRLESMSLDGKTETLLSLAAFDNVLTYHPQKQLAVINCRSGDDHAETDYETILYDLHTQKTLFRMVDEISYGYECFEDKLIATRIYHEVLSDESEVVKKQICAYDLTKHKWGTQYQIDFGIDLTPLNDEGWYLGSNNSLHTGDEPTLHLINAADGRTVHFDTLTDDEEYCGCGMDSLGYVAIAAYDTRYGTSSVYLVDPELVTADGTLKVFEQPSKEKPSDSKPGKHLSEQRKQADALEKKYGVTILIGNEIKGVKQNEVFENVSVEDSDVYTTEEEQCEITETMLQMTDAALSRYSKEFFERFRDFKGEGGLRLLFADSISSKNGSFSAGAYTTPTGNWYTICLRADSFTDNATVQTILDHELWHGVEGRVCDELGNRFEIDEWNTLNPEDFAYSNDFDGFDMSETYTPYLLTQSTDKNRVCLIDYYSAVNDKEDRATLAETILTEESDTDRFVNNAEAGSFRHAREFVLHYPLLRRKYEFMQRTVEPVFGNTYPLFTPEQAEMAAS